MDRWQKPEAENPCNASYDMDHPSRSSLDYNTPLLSARSNAITSPSPFYKLSSELSRESLRIPGAVPFMWEQTPGHRKFTASIVPPTPLCGQPQPTLAKFSTLSVNKEPAKPTLADLLQCQDVVAEVSPVVNKTLSHITLPPATESSRSYSARYSALQHNMPSSSFVQNGSFHDEFADAFSDSASDALTATACGVSVNDSLVLSGPMRLAITPSEARDFIMHRFLPAAHTIACESPQTPSRRVLPLGMSAGPTLMTPSRCNGSSRDYGGVACTDSWLASGSRCKTTNSSLIYTSPSRMPAPRRGLERSFHSDNNVSHSDEEEDEEPPSTPKACGIFPFSIHISRHSSSSKHHRRKSQHMDKKNSTITSCSHTPKRIMDVLREDQSSSYEDESPVHQLRGRHSEAERERGRVAVLRQTAMHSCGDPSPRSPYSSESYYRGSPKPHQNVRMQRCPSDLNNEEASEYGSYYDAPSRFCSPSPAALHHVNARALQSNMLSSVAANPQSTRISVCSTDDNPHPAIISTTEQHLLNSSLRYYNMHTSINNKPHSYHPHIAPPSSCLPHPPSQVNSSHESTTYDNITTDTNTEYWDAFSRVNHSEQRARIINNVLYEHEAQETNNVSDANFPSMSHIAALSYTSTRIIQGNETQPGDAKWHVDANGDVHASKSAQNRCDHVVSDCDHDMGDNNLNGGNHVSNGDGVQHEYKGNGNLRGARYACNGMHRVANGCLHACHGAHYVCAGNHNVGNGGVHNATTAGDNTGDLHEAKMGILGFSSSLLSPPLPKSPTHSWLDRAIPLVASASGPNTSSRLSHTHNKATMSAAKHGKQALPAANSKWEALVKGSHLQPGHLRFSEELLHQQAAQTIVSGAS